MSNNFKNVKKPQKQEEQIDLIWEYLFNYLLHKVRFMDLKIGFILGFITLMLALLGILIFKT
jgi:hypothetical protein